MALDDDLREQVARARAWVGDESMANQNNEARLPAARDLLRALLATTFRVLETSGVRAGIGCMSSSRKLVPGPLMYEWGRFAFTSEGDLYRTGDLPMSYLGASEHHRRNQRSLRTVSSKSGGRRVVIYETRSTVEPRRPSGYDEAFYLEDSQVMVGYCEGGTKSAEEWASQAVSGIAASNLRGVAPRGRFRHDPTGSMPLG